MRATRHTEPKAAHHQGPEMTRVIAGAAGGRRLAVPPGTGTRPTSDRAREGLFSTWQSLLGGRPLDGERVLDLYAGSGAVGLEALSRGAGHTLLVEADARAARVIRENVRNLALPGAEVRAGKARQVIEAAPAAPYDLVFLDPPYAVPDDDLREILLTLRSGGWLAAEALVTVERSTRGGEFGWPVGFEALRARRYGEGTFWYGRAASTCEDAR
ncbi:16S rRNA (guanine(966)-N(2))-methyltransferase RsmD [Streptomyces sp. NBC_00199]|uniref:16S rRNA (guanine(966)-N(2))-methyltransferase RsmD n=1 Tax=Streptomyces sp. NBC_00199 TaxID=2975678 RepID=UPI0022534921|nr:16S rRNA (guanine(966)-N(2))-methyltransferase RsmD [Streptomyces sp. NBC_00199]MCX5267943.1 16S rRNA (guanine(966)-N(2))-methyltransferase RsmD [Streptomyces sp. NBC_00199]